jgi:hypothetical protein
VSGSVELLRPLERVRARREDAALRALHEAAQATREAQRLHEQAVQARRDIEDDIASTLDRPFLQCSAQGTVMARVHASRRRVELLRDHLFKARERERAALAELETRRAAQARALSQHFAARVKHDSARDQLQRTERAISAQQERVQLEATQEMAMVRASSAALSTSVAGVNIR